MVDAPVFVDLTDPTAQTDGTIVGRMDDKVHDIADGYHSNPLMDDTLVVDELAPSGGMNIGEDLENPQTADSTPGGLDATTVSDDMEGSDAVDRVHSVDGTREVDDTYQVDGTFAVDKTDVVDIYEEVDMTAAVDGTAVVDETDQVDEIDDTVGMNIGRNEGIPPQVDVCQDISDLVDKTDVAAVILQSTGSNTVTDDMVVDASDTHLIASGKPSSIADCETGVLNAWSEWPGVKDVVDGVTRGGECSSEVNTPHAYTFEEVDEVPNNVAEAAGNKRVPRPSHYLTDDQLIGDPRLKALYASRTKKPIYHPIASVEESDFIIFKQILEETPDE
ncbi:hypothetical protein AALP_AA6G324600 [Arabis alpina]|uniref:Uncharacterized protein n=1 Tax=Arabis alpina TaxID=50452 RepID=A0A087GT57_ARAAL|nr:hypothetical protein AALP_AA6G324600 [Arabis alpina]